MPKSQLRYFFVRIAYISVVYIYVCIVLTHPTLGIIPGSRIEVADY